MSTSLYAYTMDAVSVDIANLISDNRGLNIHEWEMDMYDDADEHWHDFPIYEKCRIAEMHCTLSAINFAMDNSMCSDSKYIKRFTFDEMSEMLIQESDLHLRKFIEEILNKNSDDRSDVYILIT